jgi:MFS family permease
MVPTIRLVPLRLVQAFSSSVTHRAVMFAIGYVGRVVGAVLFGHLGDRYGRKRQLVTTLLLMGVSTSLMGLLPGYSRWGAWSYYCLASLRGLQGGEQGRMLSTHGARH